MSSSTSSQLKKVSKKKGKTAGAIMESKIITLQGQSALAPQMISKEKEMLYASQVLIPTNVTGKRLSLNGPLP